MTLLKKISKLQLLYAILVTIGIAFLLVMISDLIIMPIYTKHGAGVELPDIVEKPVLKADSLLSKHGFKLVIDDSEYHPVLPESTVVFQKPSPYTRVKRGRRIYVTISAGERQVIVPRIVGISERDAQLKIIQAGLALGEISYNVSTYPQNVVCAQDLSPNSEVPENTAVSYSVSLGRSKSVFIVPDVIGRQFNEGVMMIKREGLRVGKITSKIHDDLIPNTIIKQTPDPGMEVQPESPVHLIISKLSDESTTGDNSAFN